jgi:hypothetical protein
LYSKLQSICHLNIVCRKTVLPLQFPSCVLWMYNTKNSGCWPVLAMCHELTNLKCFYVHEGKFVTAWKVED